MKLHVLLFLLIPFTVFGQAPAGTLLCGNEVWEHLLSTRYPDLDAAFHETFEQTARAAKAGGVQDRSPLVIDVVVHVVWKTAAENLADSIIENQIAILNRDFNGENADSLNTRTLFRPVAGKANIRFRLASIVRRQTSTNFTINLTSGALLSNLKSNSTGGSDPWSVERYLNIWVCNIRPATIIGIPLAQILGFAFPPNGLSNWPAGTAAPTPNEDGVVIDYRVFGGNNPNPIAVPGGTGNLTVRGRTAVHEVGHYLGLRHIWGDGGGLLSSTNDCKQSDGIDDTPFANAQSNFDCNQVRNTCKSTESFYNADVPDMTENYMDYSREDCMSLFTKGQVAHMRATLSGPRAGLVQSVGTQQPRSVALGMRVFPNPVVGQTFVQYTLSEAQTTVLSLWDATGRLVRQYPEQSGSTGMHTQSLDVEGVPEGVFFVQLRTPHTTATQRIVVGRQQP